MKRLMMILLLLSLSCQSNEVAARPGKEPTTKLVDIAPVKSSRRLYTEALSASSFLDQAKTSFWERYHPNYAMDGDPNTAWNEGAEGSGAGEWLRVPITPQEGVTSIKLRLLNGFQRSEALYLANARAKTMEITLSPNHEKKTFPVEDKMGWQEFLMEGSTTKVDSIQITITEAYEGKKYKDLAISEVEIFVTSVTPEDPARETTKQRAIKTWIEEQHTTGALFKSDGLAKEYELASTKKITASEEMKSLIAQLDEKPPMVSAQLSSTKGKRVLPELFQSPCRDLSGPFHVEGSEVPDAYINSEGTIPTPCFERFPLFTNINIIAAKKKAAAGCANDVLVPEESINSGAPLRRIVIHRCSRYTLFVSERSGAREDMEESEGSLDQILLFDEDGLLRLITRLDTSEDVAFFNWTKQEGAWGLSEVIVTQGAELVPMWRAIAK